MRIGSIDTCAVLCMETGTEEAMIFAVIVSDPSLSVKGIESTKIRVKARERRGGKLCSG